MSNPLFGRSGKHGQRSEKRVAKLHGAKLQPGSGAFAGRKGDMRKGRFLVEAKATIHSSASIQLGWLIKITQEAAELGCDPLLFLSFVNGSGEPKVSGDWVLMPKYVFDELNQEGAK
jgi:hypothetical protein